MTAVAPPVRIARTTGPPTPATARSVAWTSGLVGATAVATGVELLVLRLFTRTAIHIPALEQLAPLYHAAAWVGRFAFHAAVVLLALSLLVLVVDLARTGAGDGRLASTAAGVFLGAAVAARAGWIDAPTTAAVVVASVGVLAWCAAHEAGRAAIPLLCFGGAFTLAGADAVFRDVAATGGSFVASDVLPYAAEVLAIAAAVTSPLVVASRPHRRSIFVGTLVGVTVAGAIVVNGATIKILALWNFGLAGVLPTLCYGVAAGALTITIVTAWRTRDRVLVVAFLLLVAGGIGLHSTYQSGLVVAGLGLVVLGLSAARLPAGSRQATHT